VILSNGSEGVNKMQEAIYDFLKQANHMIKFCEKEREKAVKEDDKKSARYWQGVGYGWLQAKENFISALEFHEEGEIEDEEYKIA
jgi:hypothetical protein